MLIILLINTILTLKTDTYIVCSEIGNCIDPSTYRKWFSSSDFSMDRLANKGIIEKAGLSGRITPHTLRHTFASTAFKYGIIYEEITGRLLYQNEISVTPKVMFIAASNAFPRFKNANVMRIRMLLT